MNVNHFAAAPTSPSFLLHLCRSLSRSLKMAGFQVPVWAVENRARFLRAPGAAGDCPSKPLISPASVFRSMYGTEALARSGVVVERAGASGMLTTNARINPPPPGQTPGVQYFLDVENHPDVLSTILETARVTAGYSPATGPGNGTNIAEATKQHDAFLRFLEEVDQYYAYVNLEGMETQRIQNTRHDCATLLNAVSSVVEAALGAAGQGLTERIQNTVRAVAEYVTSSSSSNSVYNVGYQNVNLPAPVAGQNSNRDPTTALCFSIVGMTRDVVNGVFKTTTDTSDYFYITAATYRLRSSAIIAYAEYLAGSSIIPAEDVAAAMNARP